MGTRKHRNKTAAKRPARHPPARSATASGTDWLYGRHAVLAALRNPNRRCRRLLMTAEAERAVGDSTGTDPAPEIVERNRLNDLMPGAVHQGVALLADPLPEPGLAEAASPAADRNNTVLVLDQVSDPHNVGAILRSADAFAARAIVTTDRNAPSATGALAKAASGAVERVPMVRVANLAQALDTLGQLGYWRIGLAADGERDLADCREFGNVALVLGAEGKGLRRLTAAKCDLLARIPMPGAMTSLNVSNAAAVALYELCRQR